MMAGDASETYQLFYLGVYRISPIHNDCQRSVEEAVVDQVEHAQITGKLPKDRKRAIRIAVHVSEHGIKLVDISDGKVLDRMPLHKIILATSYDDGFGNYNVVLLIQQSQHQQCYLLQSAIGEDTDNLCNQIKQVFLTVARGVKPF